MFRSGDVHMRTKLELEILNKKNTTCPELKL